MSLISYPIKGHIPISKAKDDLTESPYLENSDAIYVRNWKHCIKALFYKYNITE